LLFFIKIKIKAIVAPAPNLATEEFISQPFFFKWPKLQTKHPSILLEGGGIATPHI
jgi:hypothetical protein